VPNQRRNKGTRPAKTVQGENRGEKYSGGDQRCGRPYWAKPSTIYEPWKHSHGLLVPLAAAFSVGLLSNGHAQQPALATNAPVTSGNPVFPGWYADPEAKVFGKEYWIYPTYSAPYEAQTFFDAFSSPDLAHWAKHSRIMDTHTVPLGASGGLGAGGGGEQRPLLYFLWGK
jgi:hypothetical protein